MRRHSNSSARRGFTLIELLVAIVILATLTTALSTMLSSSFRSRERVMAHIDAGLLRSTTAHTIERDLAQMVVPTGTLAGPMLGETNRINGGAHADTVEFYTASGELEPDLPWGEVIKVKYSIVVPTTIETGGTLVLLRTVTRNLLASVDDTPEESVLLKHPRSLAIQYYDGSAWTDSWDSTALGDILPKAVRILVDYAASDGPDEPVQHIEIVREVSQQSANAASSGGAGS